MICIWRRSARSSPLPSRVTSCPSKVTLPSVGSMRRRMQRPAVVLPQPLSPTSPSTSPGITENEIPSTALTWPTVRENSPFLIGKCFLRPATWSSGSGTARFLARDGVEPAGGDLLGAPAARQVVGAEPDQRRIGAAAVLGHRAARMEAAAGREAQRARDIPGDDAQTLVADAEPRKRCLEPCGIGMQRA